MYIYMYIYNYHLKENQLYGASDFHIYQIYSFLTTGIFLSKSGFDFLFQIHKNESWDSFNLHVKM